jgi:hypothetical protein
MLIGPRSGGVAMTGISSICLILLCAAPPQAHSSCLFLGKDRSTITETRGRTNTSLATQNGVPIRIRAWTLQRRIHSVSWLMSYTTDYEYDYLIYDFSFRGADGRPKLVRRIDVQHAYAACFYVPEKLHLAGDRVYVELTVVPRRYIADSHRGWPLFQGYPRIMRLFTRNGPELKTPKRHDLGLYKWKRVYPWVDISGPEYESAVAGTRAVDLRELSLKLMPKDFSESYDYYLRREAPETKEKEFFTALKAGATDKVGAMLGLDPGLVSARDVDGKTALHLALEREPLRTMLPLIFQHNPDVNAVDFTGQTPLFSAARSSCSPSIKSDLIARGALILFAPSQFYRLAGQYQIDLKYWEQFDCGRKDGWMGTNAFGLWVPGAASTAGGRPANLGAGRREIARALQIQELQDPPVTSLSLRLQWILDNARIMCESESPFPENKRYFICIFGQGLRSMIDEYVDLRRR